MSRIVNTSMPKHHAEISFLRELLFDIKKQVLGLPTKEPITTERIDNAKKMLSRLEECRMEIKIKH